MSSEGAATTGSAVGRAPRLRGAGRQTALAARLGVARWSGYAWGAIAATAAFIAMTIWWLSQDRSIPIYDAGHHLEVVFAFHSMIASGNWLGPFEYNEVYPPLGHLVGALGTLIGGVTVPAPIIAQNLVFVPLLALGVYQTGRLLFGSAAGLLAVIFVLCTPLLIAQLHNFMLDPPMTAMVAVSLWLLLASRDFERMDYSLALGVAAGIGMLVKVQYPVYLAGLVLLMLARGGWRNWRGFLAFLAVGTVIAAPWYIVHISEFGRITEIAGTGTGSGVQPDLAPPPLSSANFLWYFWSVLNSQLLVPLFLLTVGGALWMFVTLRRRRGGDAYGGRLELLAGCFLTWLTITITPHHDIRYGMPLIPYMAVIGTGWIVCLPRRPALAALALLVLGAGANTLGVTFGVGDEEVIALTHPLPKAEEESDRVIFYATQAFVNAAPSRDGNVPGLLDELHRAGVRLVAVSLQQSAGIDFSFEGLVPLGEIAGLQVAVVQSLEFGRSPEIATLIHEPVGAGSSPTCTRVSDGTGVWVARFDAAAGKLALYCPSRRIKYYAIGHVH